MKRYHIHKAILFVLLALVMIVSIKPEQLQAESSNLFTIGSGSSALITSTVTTSTTIYVKGTAFDYVKYDDDGDVVYYGQEETSDTYTVALGQRVIVTNTGSGAVTIEAKTRPLMMGYSSAPALKKVLIGPNQSVTAINNSDVSESIEVGGDNDYAKYDEFGNVLSFTAGDAPGSLTIPAGEKAVVTNKEASGFYVYGAYETFTLTTRSAPAVFHYLLDQGETAQVVSHASKTFTIDLEGGRVEYAIYDNEGQLDSYGQTSIGYRIVSAGETLIVTNLEAETLDVVGPYDAFTVSPRPLPALQTKTLTAGASVRVKNTGQETSTLNFEGTYDYAKYDAAGEVAGFAKGVGTTTGSIPAGGYIDVTPASTGTVKVIGPADSFQFTDRSNPALYKSTVTPGQSLEAVNVSGGTAGFTLNGVYDYALFESGEGITGYKAYQSTGTLQVQGAGKVAFTNKDTLSTAIFAPYDAFSVSARANPVTYEHTLAPGETIKADNTSLASFTLAASSQHHYVVYDNGDEVSEYGRPTISGSYTIDDTESLVMTNSGTSNLKLSGPRDAFSFSSRTNPALLKMLLAPNTSLKANSTSASNFGLDLSGTYDQASYMADGKLRSFDRKTGLTELMLYEGERVTLTNSGSLSLQVIAPYDVTQILSSTTPALSLRSLAPGQSAEFRNIVALSANLEITGTHDLMDYNAAGSPFSYARDRTLNDYSISSGTHTAIENSGTSTIEAYGAYELIAAIDRSEPVTFKRTLPTGSSLDMTNQSSKLFSIYPSGLYDYALYDGSGDAADAYRGSGLASKTVPSDNRLAFTNVATGSIVVEGPYDVFTIQARTNPALFKSTLSSGQSMEAAYTGANQGDVHMTDEYDYALFTPQGKLDDYGRNQTTSSKQAVNKDEKAAIENSYTGSIVVYGAYDVFETHSRSNPVTFKKTLSPGQSFVASNTSDKPFFIYPSGVYDFVLFDSAGELLELDRKSASPSKYMLAGRRITMTNTYSSDITIEGAFDAFAVANRVNPALFVNQLASGASMEATNKSAADAAVHASGIYDFAMYTSAGAFEAYGNTVTTSSHQNVEPGNKIAVQNSDEAPIEVYGAYDYFQLNTRSNPVTFVRTLGPDDGLELHSTSARQLLIYIDGSYDYARYEADGSVESFYTWQSSGLVSLTGDDKLVLSPAEAQTITVKGSYDGFALTEREERAVTVKSLEPGQNFSFRNVSPSSFSAKISGVYDYQMYSLTGTMETFGNDSSLSSRSVQSTKRLVILNADTVANTVTVPTDAIQVTNGDGTDQFVKGIESGESIKALNTSSVKSSLVVSGRYDIAIYTGAGVPVSYARESNAVSVSIPASHYAVLTGRQTGGTVVSGYLTAFEVTEQEETALKVVTPGYANSVELQSLAAVPFSVTLDGSASWVKYDADNSALDYGWEHTRDTLILSSDQRIVITSPRLDGLQIWGPYQSLQSTVSEEPALVQEELGAGKTLTAVNLTGASRTLKAGGIFTYRIGQAGNQTGINPLAVLANGTAYLRNTGSSYYVVYAPYGHFGFTAGGSVSGPISGKDAADKIAALDPADYDPQSFHADPIDTATGAQIINRTLITAHGAVPIPFQAQYHSLLSGEGALGQDWSHNFEIRLVANEEGSSVKVYWNAFRGNTFVKGLDGQFASSEAAAKCDKLTRKPDGTYELRRNDGAVYLFAESGQLAEMAGKTGERLLFGYSQDGRLSTVSDPLTDAELTLGYDAADKLSTVTDQAGRQASFAYDGDGRLSVITDTMDRETTYAYDSSDRIVSAMSDAVQLFVNEFDNEGRVVKQHDAIPGSTPTLFFYEQTDDILVTTITARNGNVQKRTHDSNYRLLSVEDELGRVTSYGYDSDGNRTSVTNAANQTTTFAYDANGNLISSTDYTGQSVAITYDGANNLLTAAGPDGITVTNTYDSGNRLLSVQIPNSGMTTYTYNSNGLLESAKHPLEGMTLYSYTGNRLTGTTNAEGDTTNFAYDEAGRMVSESDAEGYTTTLSYNAGDELISETNPLGHAFGYSYDAQGFLASRTDALGRATTYSYDENGNLTAVMNALDETASLHYDGEGRLLSIVDPLGRAVAYAYDDAGNLLTETNPNGGAVRYVYDSLNRLTEAYDSKNKKVYAVTYDESGNLKTVTDALNESYTNMYDSLNRLTQTIDPLQRVTSYAYDGLSRLTSVTDPMEGKSTQAYDALSRITEVVDPNLNAASYTYDLVGRIIGEIDAAGGNRTYTYNARGLLSGDTNARGQETTYAYDAAGQLAGFTDLAGSVTYTYDGNGNITAVTDGNGKTLIRDFDELDRVESYTDEDGNTIRYAYNQAGELTSLMYPDGKIVTYTYDAAGRMNTVTDWDGRVTMYAYDVNGQLISTTRPNGTVETRAYDAKGQLVLVTDTNAEGSVLYAADYTYDAVGNVRSEDISAAETVTSSTYGEIPLAVDINGPGLSPTMELSSSSNSEMTYGADNRLMANNGQDVIYDADGNMTLGPLDGSMQGYVYDARNRLTEAGGISYGYNNENERTSVTVNGMTTKYVINPHALLSQVLMETDEQGQAKAWYVYGLGLIGREDAAGNYQTYHYDRRGSTIALTDELGQATDTYQYGNYGESLGHEGESEQPFRYNGRDGVMTDPNGLYHMRARYYNPEIKRFINRDVLSGSVGNGQTLNRYAYVNGNPVSYVDPFGLSRDGDSIWLQGGSFLADAVPWVGTIKGFQQAFTGMNYVTGEQLTVSGRWSEGVGAAFSLIPIPGLKYAGKYGTDGVIWAGKRAGSWFAGKGKTLNRMDSGSGHIPMNTGKFNRMKNAFERHGGLIVPEHEAVPLLNWHGTEASTLNATTIAFRPNPSTSAVFEEFIHATQYRTGRASGSNILEMEIEAKEKLIRYRKAYGIPNSETRETIQHLRGYRKELDDQRRRW
ncbi:RHS repeat-associated protein [Paenibacillus endophyticus]|uniref:RHS repeat-associated protein n=1 Tax=Paenibacillus endophyticus TaxID=1294268 RepID=A0A7W5C7J8_9BACL|nr:RHS repeat-associated core domain-containing protein [Paenibacillus endophyticus]MBB3152556.1 RHS repeat-associated protein [Paenibacillus endophyticus]